MTILNDNLRPPLGSMNKCKCGIVPSFLIDKKSVSHFSSSTKYHVTAYTKINVTISHLFQVLVHPLCEGLLLYGIPFIWGREDQLKKEEMKKMTRKPRKLLTDVSAAPPLNRSRICHLVTDLASFKREPHWCAQPKTQMKILF